MGGVYAKLYLCVQTLSGQPNRVADALSRRHLIVQENQVQVLGFEYLRYLYEVDSDFQNAYRACKNPVEVTENCGLNTCYRMVCYLKTVNYVFLSAL